LDLIFETKKIMKPLMKAAICTQYGPPEVLQIKMVEKQTPRKNEILVKIIASAVSSADIRIRKFDVKGFFRLIMWIIIGFKKPRKPILGVVFSGIVEQIGGSVKCFQVGDEIFGLTGFRFGAHAEYIILPDKCIAIKKPMNATFEEAAAMPFGGHTAIYFLEKAKIPEKPYSNILIYGATGSVGTAAIQIAKHYHATVTAVCSEKGETLVKKLGANNIVLYDKEEFSESDEKFDIIFDAVGKISKKQCAHLLSNTGRFVTVGGFETAIERKEQLELLCKLFEIGKYNAAIDKIYTIDNIVEAHRYVDTGHKKGNVIIKME
jgi:NADPH:quinone reductase-like Zn-dependent oxidoreductase